MALFNKMSDDEQGFVYKEWMREFKSFALTYGDSEGESKATESILARLKVSRNQLNECIQKGRVKRWGSPWMIKYWETGKFFLDLNSRNHYSNSKI